MCGIVCAFNIKSNSDAVRSNVLKMAKKVRHRGPDWSGVYSNHNAVLAHERLAIVDPTSGKQPIISEDGCKVIAVNGEIYNHLEIRSEIEKNNQNIYWRGHSDTETILRAFETFGIENSIKKFIGMFAFSLWDKKNNMSSGSNKGSIIARTFADDSNIHTTFRVQNFIGNSRLNLIK